MSMEKSNEFDVRKIVRVVLEHWWWFVVCMAVFVGLGFLHYYKKTPTWQTDASVVLRLQDVSGNRIDALSLLGMASSPATDDEVIVLSSRGLMAQSLDALNLWETSFVKDGLSWKEEYRTHAFSIENVALNPKTKSSPFYITIKPTRSGYKVTARSGYWYHSTTKVDNFDEPIETAIGTIRIHPRRPLSKDTTYRALHMRRELLVAEYSKLITVTQHRKESNIIKLTMCSSLPSRDKALLAQLIEQYNMNAIVDKNMIASNTAAFINERMNHIEAELLESERNMAAYKEKHHITDLDLQSRLFVEGSSTEQKAIADIETQLSLVDYVDAFMHDDTKRNNLIPANLGINDAALETSLSEYNAILLQRMRIQRTATETNPVLEQMDSQLHSMRQHIIATIGSVRESLNIRRKNMQEQDSKYNRQIQNAPEKEREYVRVVRDQKIKEQLYLFLYEKREENALMLAATSMPAKILDAPQQDVLSREPKLSHILLICIFLGLLVPAGVLYALMLFSNTIDDEKDFEQRIKAPLLGHLVENSRQTHIAVHEGESTLSDELFRSIRTNLRFVLPSDVKSPVILVSSYMNGEGKSYVATNIALSLAILGKKVALVGMDIRKPVLASRFGLRNNGHLTDYLADADMKTEDIIVPSGEHKNLDLIPCGTVPPNPAELLQTERVETLFAELRKRYDYIIVDTAPVALASDTYLLDRVADMTIFVCRFKYTPMEMVDYVNHIIEQKRMHNVVCVLNGVKGLHAEYGYGQQ